MLHTVSFLALSFDTTPQAPPGSAGLLKIIGWISWAVSAALICAVLVAGAKFAWERWHSGATEAPKMLVGALVGAVIAGSAGAILNGVAPA